MKSKEPVRHWLDLRSDLGMWYYAENDGHLEIIKGQLGFHLDRYQKQLRMSGGWQTGEWYASNIDDLENYDCTKREDDLIIYSLTEFKKEVDMSIQSLQERGNDVSSRQ